MSYPQRGEYMAGKISHHDWYLSVARSAGLLRWPIGSVTEHQRWAKMLENGDEHLNGLRLPYWDSLAASRMGSIKEALKLHGDFWSLAGGVCVVKAAARAIVEQMGKEVSS